MRTAMQANVPTPSNHVRNVRGSGRSLSHALAILATAVANPGVPVACLDHHGTHQADRHLFDLTWSIARAMDLDIERDSMIQSGDTYPTLTFTAPFKGVRGEAPYVSR